MAPKRQAQGHAPLAPLVLSTTAHYAWSDVVRQLAAGDLRGPAEHYDLDTASFAGPVMLARQPYWVTIVSHPSRAAALTLTVEATDDAPNPSPATWAAAAAWARQRFAMDIDMDDVRRVLAANPLGQELLRRCWPRRLVVATDLWTYLVFFLCGATHAAPCFRQLVLHYGQPVRFGATTYKRAPTPVQLAQLAPEQLRVIGCSPGRASNLIRLGQYVTLHPLDDEVLRAGSGAAAIDALQRLPHIGARRAAGVTIYGLGHADITDDAAAGSARLHDTLFGAPATPWATDRHDFNDFSPYRSLALHYIDLITAGDA